MCTDLDTVGDESIESRPLSVDDFTLNIVRLFLVLKTTTVGKTISVNRMSLSPFINFISVYESTQIVLQKRIDIDFHLK